MIEGAYRHVVKDRMGQAGMHRTLPDAQAPAEGLRQRRREKRYEKALTRIGRLRQRYSRVVRYYDIHVEKDEASGNAKTLQWTRITPLEDTLPGVYCLPAKKRGASGSPTGSGVPEGYRATTFTKNFNRFQTYEETE